ncbi:imidazolonepropionase-like domain-containing protein [Streptomyces bambusae]|uniref:Aminodeoxyfutalosine deaminase/Imidazolonepropionase-like composite domain-containing protein n=1 Tax=Streptomyces bambusae TaxID=1550616 RepID=A0ABS6Z4D0_9ACTN|nr:hypothetical protein [Streptomyces bambusae]MBW5482610.1 hypothetical protein [Streptomyces bambusae]
MLTLHTADLLVPAASAEPVPHGAVLVDGDRIAGLGPYEDLAAAYPHARTRRWPGLLTPGLVAHGVRALLEETYYPDGRTEAELGTEPLRGAALAALGPLSEARRGHSARRGTQKLLARGVVAVTGELTVASVRTAVARSGLVLAGPGSASASSGEPSPDPFAGCSAAAEAYYGGLGVGAPARFAAFAVADEAELLAEGATTCVATVVDGRLLHRRR